LFIERFGGITAAMEFGEHSSFFNYVRNTVYPGWRNRNVFSF